MKAPQAIPLKDAGFCVNCSTLVDAFGKCPVCGSEQIYPLTRWFKPVAEAA